MKISKEWLIKMKVFRQGLRCFLSQTETDGVRLVKKLILKKELNCAHWLLIRIMNDKQLVDYAVFATEQVICLYEKQHPGDQCLRPEFKKAKVQIAELRKSDEYANAAKIAVAAYGGRSPPAKSRC